MTNGVRKSQAFGGTGPRRVDTSSGPPPGIPTLGLVVALIVIFMIWVLTYPFNFQPRVMGPWLGNNRIGKLNTLANVIFFVPYGVLLAWWGSVACVRRWVVIVAAGLSATIMSLSVETAQVWLPVRASSVVDVVANTWGALAGAVMGWLWAPLLTGWWRSFIRWLEVRPMARRAIILMGFVLAARTAPFDISPETLYLRLSLQDTVRAGWPMFAVTAWWADTTGHQALRQAAYGEMIRVGVTGGLFLLATVTTGAAVLESTRRRGDPTFPIGAIILLGVGLVLTTEFIQWPVRSRTMDASDAMGGIMGVCLGALLGEALFLATCHRRRRRDG